MPNTLFTTYADHDLAFTRLLSLATRRIDIFDRDLALFKLEQPARHGELKRLLAAADHRLRIVVQDAQTTVARHPLLMRLLETHGHHFELIEADGKLRELTDSIVLADGAHALIRFHRDQPRGKLIENEEDAVKPYERRYQAIVEEGGIPISPRVAGL